MLKLYNTLTRKIEEFIPINPPHVGMYTCGPTVYDFMHIGNLRTFIFSDILCRTLEANDYEVKAVQNITDIDDKIIKRAKEREISISELANEFTKYFLEDISKLNILSSNVLPKATEHIGKMIKYIEVLMDKGLAYVEKDGSVYFDISKFSDYGKLSRVEKRELKTGTRILSDEYTKDDIQDFALWKSAKRDEVGWDSPWGWGTPGWHIECSVMSQEYLGDTFDIHAGGIDLVFPHHENEIAQSEGKTGKKFVNYFVHGEHILVNNQKMSKSLRNFYRIDEIKEKGFDPLALRYLFLTAHYRDKLNFTWKSMEAAQNALNNLREEIRGWPSFAEASEGKQVENRLTGQSDEAESKFWQRFLEAANNDLNMPQAIAVLWEMIHKGESTSEKSAVLLKMDKILGLGLDEYLGKQIEVPEKVMKLVHKREQLRKSGDFKGSDKLRYEIKKLGYEVEDNPFGAVVKNAS